MATGASGSRRLDAASLDEMRAQLVSWTIAVGAGAAWLALVHLTPVPAPPNTSAGAPSEPLPPIQYVPNVPDDAPRGLAAGGGPGVVDAIKGKGAAAVRKAVERLEVASAFTATVGVQAAADVARIMRAVEPTPGSPTSAVIAGVKTALATGGGPRTPGMTKLEAREGGIPGTVGPGGPGRGTIARSEVVAQPLPVVSAPGLSGAGADAAQVGGFVREHTAQLQTCYERETRGRSGTLAGLVTLRLTLGDGGVVRDASVIKRTWEGPGAEATERCMLAAVRRWTLPSGGEGATVTLPISFTGR